MDVRGFLDVISAPKKESGDYYDAEGFLMCGRCHTRKQIDIPCSETVRPGGIWRVPVSCKCAEEAQWRAAEEERKKQLAGIGKKLFEKSGLNAACAFAMDKEPESNASLICRRYIAKLDEAIEAGLGILFHGGVGTGKTFYAQCIGNAAVRRCKSVLFKGVSDILLAEKSVQEDILRRAGQCDLLILDDIGTQRKNSYGDEVLYNVIDTRYKSGKLLIATTNLSVTEMESCAEISNRRIYDRLLEMCPIRVKVDGVSKRAEIAKEKREKAKKMILGGDK